MAKTRWIAKREKAPWGEKDMSWLLDDEDDAILDVVDAHWAPLTMGDSVMAIKDLKVKWAPDIKRWDKFKNIKLKKKINQ